MGKNKSKKGDTKESEADHVKQLIKDMPKTIEVGSVWYIVSMSWIHKWQQFTGFDGPSNNQNPGKIDSSDIIESGGVLLEQTEKLNF
jgi:hypothetical protein